MGSARSSATNGGMSSRKVDNAGKGDSQRTDRITTQAISTAASASNGWPVVLDNARVTPYLSGQA